MLKPNQTRRIYAMGALLGILESGNKNDTLHTLVYSLTQKESIKSLSEQEYYRVVSELSQRLRAQNAELPAVHPYKAKKYADSVGKMSDGQRRKVWRLMYALEELDLKPSSARRSERLCGIIRKELHVDCVPEKPFEWLSYQQGAKLIEIVKKYVANAQRKMDGAGR